ncbi:MAG: Cd2+/Zn2+-exporting ATPase [Erysipelotrichaceae bacterium]|nr:MAG: Cd2+/Zn2+-exporting [Erysipelotrichaceae bacterium]TXT18089.1 MAG: Cd2+/Zn2+-exporting ATPase [Erysipelotrichaceae bacterium]
MTKNTTTVILDGLDCANCALKIEEAVNKIEGVSHATLDFTTQKLKVEYVSSLQESKVLELATAEALRIEPGLSVLIDGQPKVETDKKWTQEHLGWMSGTLIFGIVTLLQLNETLELVLYGVSYLLIGYDVLARALRNTLKGQMFDENFLMSIATIGAFAIGEYPEGVAVMLFYKVGELFQNHAVDHSRKSIAALMDIRPDVANVDRGLGFVKVSPLSVEVGEVVLIKVGEKVPLDGIIIEGNSLLDTSSITGESLLKEVSVGQEIYSGTINKTGVLKVEVTKSYKDSTVSKILDLVENASSKKATTEQFISKFAKVYTPIVVFVALALAFIPPLVIPGAQFQDWLYRALVFLVVSCPCALVISIPLSYFGGIGGASKHGILMKGGNYLEALKSIDTLVFDKTGTLTKGQFTVTKIVSLSSSSQDDILKAAALAESHSNHPIALSIMKAYGKVNQDIIKSVEENSGLGLKVITLDQSILVGNEKFMNQNGFSIEFSDQDQTTVHVAINGVYAGYLLIEDEIKGDAVETIRQLKNLGIPRIVMLTGDSDKVGNRIAQQLGIDEVYTELMPQDKVEKVEWLESHKQSKGKLVFVGDGINDAPVLTRADVGIAMGALGSDAAIEAADVVLMTDELSKIVSAIHLARYTQKIVWQNIIFAFVVKGVVLVLGAGGVATMWEAVFADVGVALLAVFNALRILNRKFD